MWLQMRQVEEVFPYIHLSLEEWFDYAAGERGIDVEVVQCVP
jgi:hypothetical protein